MVTLKRCDRCEEDYEPWSRLGRRKPPGVKLKERTSTLGVYRYTDGDLCKDCAKDLEAFMNHNYEGI